MILHDKTVKSIKTTAASDGTTLYQIVRQTEDGRMPSAPSSRHRRRTHRRKSHSKFGQRSRLRTAIVVQLLLLIALLGYGVIRSITSSSVSTSILTVPVVRMDIEQTVLANGVLEPLNQVNVGTQANGQLKSLKVKLGDRVKKGELLAEIDPVLQQNDLRKAEASLESAQAQRLSSVAQIKQYELALARQEKLFARQIGAQAELESAQAQVDTAKANLVGLDAQIRQAAIEVDTARANLAYTQIVAPMDGEVIAIVTKEGQTVVSAQSVPTILILADMDKMRVKVQISEADVERVKPGQTVYFTTLGNSTRKIYGTLAAVEPAPESIATASGTTADAMSTSAVYYNGLFDVPNPNHVLRTAMTAQVSIVLAESKNTLGIPMTALRQATPDGNLVRVLVNGKPEERTIQTGISDGVCTEVLAGLTEGEQVVIGDMSEQSSSPATM